MWYMFNLILFSHAEKKLHWLTMFIYVMSSHTEAICIYIKLTLAKVGGIMISFVISIMCFIVFWLIFANLWSRVHHARAMHPPVLSELARDPAKCYARCEQSARRYQGSQSFKFQDGCTSVRIIKTLNLWD